MTLTELKNHLHTHAHLHFVLPDGSSVPPHFHLTELGIVSTRLIDCGGKLRNEQRASLQLWHSSDTQHRLASAKLLDILEKCQQTLELPDLETEVEYQSNTIGRYGLVANPDGSLQLTATHTDCRAKDQCGTPKSKVHLASLSTDPQSACCAPGCCS